MRSGGHAKAIANAFAILFRGTLVLGTGKSNHWRTSSGAPVASSGELPLDDVVGIETGEENPEEKAQRKAGWFDGCFACDCSGCCCDCDGCCECDGCCCDGCCDCCDCS